MRILWWLSIVAAAVLGILTLGGWLLKVREELCHRKVAPEAREMAGRIHDAFLLAHGILRLQHRGMRG